MGIYTTLQVLVAMVVVLALRARGERWPAAILKGALVWFVVFVTMVVLAAAGIM